MAGFATSILTGLNREDPFEDDFETAAGPSVPLSTKSKNIEQNGVQPEITGEYVWDESVVDDSASPLSPG